jgi:tetratricopeptide (TPR) repeat protein
MAQVLELQPPKKETYVGRAAALIDAGELDKAWEIVESILMQNPNEAQALCVAADIMKKAKRLPIAYSLAKRASELRPERCETWNALGHASQLLWRLEEAESCYKKAMQRAVRDDQKALYSNNLASNFLDAGQFVKAEAPCRKALEFKEDTNARHNLGLSLLAQRKWTEGWQAYSASIGTHRRLNTKYKNPPEPTWDGSKGKRVVVYGEQGLGDEICAASLLPDVIRDSAKVIVDCDHRVAQLFKRSFPKASVYGTRWAKADSGMRWAPEDRDMDASISAFEVAKFYRNSDADFPGTSYLTPCPERTGMWGHLFHQKRKPIIGIAWTGGTWTNGSFHRHLPLAEWKPILGAIDAHWVSLQYKDAAKEIEGTAVQQYSWATLSKDYDDTAALVANCDLVLGVQTSVMHLAGALGIPCWNLIPKISQWRYGESFESIPFYKSMRLIRQNANGNWPIQQIANDLKTQFRV